MQAADDVAALIARCEEVHPTTLPLDMSFASLDRVEDFLRAHPDEQPKVASYVGQTLIHHAGGRWESPKPNSDDGEIRSSRSSPWFRKRGSIHPGLPIPRFG